MTICASLEKKFLELLSSIEGIDESIPIVGLITAAERGQAKEENLTSIHVRVFGLQQLHEGLGLVSCSVEIVVKVEQAESANGGLFYDLHEAIGGYIEKIMIGDRCVEASTDDVIVDGLQVMSGDADFDISGGEWFASWNLTLTGRIKNKED